MQINTDPRDLAVALIISGPSGRYERRIPLENTDPHYAEQVRAQLSLEDGYDVGCEYADGSVSFSD
ncbi:hypothetical protein ACTJK5_10850 [Agrobacterium sp. 22094]|jgi:ribulose bisphosphate carboxylase small subunit|uniref:hypothetical protein n=1 Tax=Agrobacterium sp. 22094 TaxID=3453872 RepID=UPI003F8407A2